MKKFILAACVAGALAVPNLMAGYSITISQSPYQSGYWNFPQGYSGDAGEMFAQVSGSDKFNTFCIEVQEALSYDTPYYYTISGSAKYDGKSPSSLNENPISIGTAYLYSQIMQGTLVGVAGKNYYNTDSSTVSGLNNRQLNARYLQAAIWLLENGPTGGKIGGVSYSGADNPFLQQVESSTLFGSLAGAQADANGAYGVFVYNLWGNSQYAAPRQDCLGIVPVPEPTTMIAGLFLGIPFAFSGIRLWRQNRKPA
jgi:hypothetical protein